MATYNLFVSAAIPSMIIVGDIYVSSNDDGYDYLVTCIWLSVAHILIYSLARFGERGKFMMPRNWPCFKAKTIISALWLTSAYIMPAAIVVVAIIGAIVGKESRLMITVLLFIMLIQTGNFIQFGAKDYAR